MTRSRHVGVAFHRAWAFWTGTGMVAVGVLLHLPDFAAAAAMHYRMAGMPMGLPMRVGMVLICGGTLLAGWGLLPRRSALVGGAAGAARYHLRAMDEASLTPAHWGLLFVLGVALVVDVMKPATLGFVMPGMKAEYGLGTLEVSIFPVSALTGTVVGSLLWGVLADRLGRRAAILLSSILFVGTAICGAMPAFGWNVFMCFLMGSAAGGMLPIVYALMAECVPAGKRGWLVVLHGGMGTAGGYLAAAGAAALLEPHFSWRVLWFLNLPTGLLMLWLNRWIPESPRFLLQCGRLAEARAVMARFGVRVEERPASPVPDDPVTGGQPLVRYAEVGRLFRRGLRSQTVTVSLYGLGWGVVNWGFITFLPTVMHQAGIETGDASRLLFFSSLLSIPGTALVAYLYGRWSSKRTMIAYALATGATLAAFAVLDPGAGSRAVLTALIVGLLVSSGGVISILSPYTAEVYPTALRGTGSGLAAASSKVGGIFGPPLVAALLSTTGTLTVPALVAAAPMVAAAVVLLVTGLETRGRRLEEIAEDRTAGDPVARVTPHSARDAASGGRGSASSAPSV
ncbi:MAG TPA: MFS transporter [Candidatus Binatia bacterium]|nr:MFS transporter [Candidatus Binatia bacterium]